MPDNDPTAAIVTMTAQEVDELLGLISTLKFTIDRPPKTGLVMMTVRDSFGSDFHVGEVLATEAEVSLAGRIGYGLVTGEEPRKALARAAADALLRGGEPAELCRRMTCCLELAGKRQARLHAEEAALVASTKVCFDLMPGA